MWGHRSGMELDTEEGKISPSLHRNLRTLILIAQIVVLGAINPVLVASIIIPLGGGCIVAWNLIENKNKKLK